MRLRSYVEVGHYRKRLRSFSVGYLVASHCGGKIWQKIEIRIKTAKQSEARRWYIRRRQQGGHRCGILPGYGAVIEAISLGYNCVRHPELSRGWIRHHDERNDTHIGLSAITANRLHL